MTTQEVYEAKRMRARYRRVISWSSVRRWLGTLLSVVVLLAGDAAADDVSPPVVVIGADAAFDEALSDTLVDNRVVSAGQLPTPALGELTAESRRIADERGATATVWLSRAANGATLVTYERKTDRFLVRELPYAPPLSVTQAAEAARMVRTMLRALTAADDSDAGDRNGPPTPASLGSDSPTAPTFAVVLGLGAWFGAPATNATAHIAPAIVWRPRAIGLSVGATLATAQPIDLASFRGDVRDLALAIELRTALRASPGVRLAPSAGLALHVVSMHGAFEAGDAIGTRRYNPALRIGLIATAEIHRALDVGLGVSVDSLLRRQKYEAAMEEILVVSRVQVMVAAIVGLSL
jgi:hypothetical protein